MLIDYQLGQNSIIVRVKLRQDNTGVKPGQGKTGVAAATAGLIIAAIADVEAATTAYTAAGSTIQTIATLGTYAAPSANNCRFGEVDSTNHPGLYEIQLANARYAVANAKSLTISITGPSGLADCDVVIPLLTVNPYDVNFALQGLKGTTNPTAGPLLTSGNGANQITVNGAGKISEVVLVDTLTTYTGNTPQTGDAYAVVNNGTYGNSALHTQIGSPWQVGTKYAVTLAAADVTGNLPANLATWLGTAPNALNNGDVQADVERWVNVVVSALVSGAVQVQVVSYASGQDPGTYLTNQGYTAARAAKLDNLDTNVGSRMATFTLPTNFSALVISAAGLVAMDGTRSPSVRNQDTVTAPTYDDCFLGAWCEAFGKETESDPQATYVKQKPDNSAPIRSFTLSEDTNGNPVGRS